MERLHIKKIPLNEASSTTTIEIEKEIAKEANSLEQKFPNCEVKYNKLKITDNYIILSFSVID